MIKLGVIAHIKIMLIKSISRYLLPPKTYHLMEILFIHEREFVTQFTYYDIYEILKALFSALQYHPVVYKDYS